MKRSHMVHIIAESLIEPRYPEDPIAEANSILRRLEARGMLPPVPRGMTLNGIVLEDLEWEPEDDED